jgi:molybdopterin/thiamine biosynthesis adenylyltransferase
MSGECHCSTYSRNIGWVSAPEQARFRRGRVAIAGLGGVGGSHLLTLTRLGVGKFYIADFDHFEVQNFNRQVGATISTLGQAKVEVLARMARDINPELEIRAFPEGVTAENLDAFLDGVDVYVDGLDFFAVEARRMVFAACHARGIPALTAAPLGMGVALLYFDPMGMSFEEYFRLEGQPRQEQLARFIAGLSPAMLQRGYLVEPSAVNFAEERGPSTAMACELCAGVMGTEVLKILLKRGPMRAAPWGYQFDAYRQKLVRTWRPFGNANPLQRLLLRIIRSKLGGG